MTSDNNDDTNIHIHKIITWQQLPQFRQSFSFLSWASDSDGSMAGKITWQQQPQQQAPNQVTLGEMEGGGWYVSPLCVGKKTLNNKNNNHNKKQQQQQQQQQQQKKKKKIQNYDNNT